MADEQQRLVEDPGTRHGIQQLDCHDKVLRLCTHEPPRFDCVERRPGRPRHQRCEAWYAIAPLGAIAERGLGVRAAPLEAKSKEHFETQAMAQAPPAQAAASRHMRSQHV